MPKTGVYEAETGQIKTTIPKGVAEAMGIDGKSKLDWTVKSKNRLEIRIEKK